MDKWIWMTTVLLSCYKVCVVGQTSGDEEAAPRRQWAPQSGTVQDFMLHHGMDPITAARQRAAVRQYKSMVAEMYGHSIDTSQESGTVGDVIYTVDQIETMIANLRIHQHAHRVKRKIMNFVKFPQNKWTFPIHYQFDGSHDQEAEEFIRSAIMIWENRTCIRFKERSPADTEHYIVIMNGTGCNSYIGNVERANVSPQPINLESPGCTTWIRQSIHEIGHALGFYHEHVRPDRDLYVNISTDNIQASKLSNFEMAPPGDIVTYGVQYDYSSTMHYAPNAFSVDRNNLDTIVPLNADYRSSMGQLLELTFLDAKLANIVYCSDICANSTLDCLRGGYPDPNDCTRCVCPTGWSGTTCDELAQGSPLCSASNLVAEETEKCVRSPGYNTATIPSGTSCYWLIQAAPEYTVEWRLPETFLPATFNGLCLQYVEIKNIDEDYGIRYCGGVSAASMLSTGNQVVMILNTDYENTDLKRFEVCYKQGPLIPTTVTESMTTSTTEQSTTTTDPTTTTIDPTTTTAEATTTTKDPTTTTTEPTTTTKSPTTTTAEPTITTKDPTTTTTEPTTTTKSPTTTTAEPTTTTKVPTTTRAEPTATTKDPTTTTIDPTTTTKDSTTTRAEPTTTTKDPTTTTIDPTTTTKDPTTTRAEPTTTTKDPNTTTIDPTTTTKDPTTTRAEPTTTTKDPTTTTKDPTTTTKDPTTTTKEPTTTTATSSISIDSSMSTSTANPTTTSTTTFVITSTAPRPSSTITTTTEPTSTPVTSSTTEVTVVTTDVTTTQQPNATAAVLPTWATPVIAVSAVAAVTGSVLVSVYIFTQKLAPAAAAVKGGVAAAKSSAAGAELGKGADFYNFTQKPATQYFNTYEIDPTFTRQYPQVYSSADRFQPVSIIDWRG